MSLLLRNLLFTIVVPGAGGVYVPWLILTRHGQAPAPAPAAWYAVPLIAAGVALYVSCVRVFAVVGRGTPGLWDAPRRFVAAGPYRWVRNPIYIAAVLIVSGEAALFGSAAVLEYAAGLALACHLFVVGYEEPRLRARFGEPYEAYRRAVSRWVPHRPGASSLSRTALVTRPSTVTTPRHEQDRQRDAHQPGQRPAQPEPLCHQPHRQRPQPAGQPRGAAQRHRHRTPSRQAAVQPGLEHRVPRRRGRAQRGQQHAVQVPLQRLRPHA